MKGERRRGKKWDEVRRRRRSLQDRFVVAFIRFSRLLITTPNFQSFWGHPLNWVNIVT